MLMTAAGYRESLRAYKPRVFVNGRAVGPRNSTTCTGSRTTCPAA